MNKDRKGKGNVPNLRFPEFKEEWEEKVLGEIAEIIGGGTPSTAIEEYWNGEIQWFTPSEIKSNYVSKSERTITKLGLTKSSAKLLPIGTILMTTRATIGEVAIANEECSTNQGFQSLVTKEGVNNIFVANWIKQNKKELIKRAKGSTFAEISKSEIETISILIPAISEQNKIAKFLFLLDERITTQNKIIEKYESLIKGIVDFLFSKKEKSIKLKDCITCHSSTLTENEVLEKKGIYPVYGAAGVFAYYPNYNISEDSILIIKDGSNVGKLQYASNKYSVIGTLNYLTAKTSICLKYIYYYMQTISFEKYKVGSGIPHIYFKDYGNELIYCPTLTKQEKIAHALSLIDEKILLEKDLLGKYVWQKTYMLTNLFR